MRCPITGGLQTRMSRSSFLKICREKRCKAKDGNKMYGWVGVGAKNKACLECSGIPAEVEFVEVNVARKTYTPGKCATCGKEANLTKSNGYRVCSTCEHLVRGVKNKPELIRRLLSQIHGDQPGNGTAVSERELFELKEANAAMAGTLDDIRVALGVSSETPGGALPGMLQRELDKLRAQLKHRTVTLESKTSPADHLPVSRLLADRDLLAAVNLLAGAMGER